MTVKSGNSTTSTDNNNNNTNSSKYSHETNTNNQDQKDFSALVNRLLDETKDNINRSIEESRNQIPRYNEIVNSYQEQSLQTAKEISEEYIESQKAVINSSQSALEPYSERYTSLVTNFATSPASMTKGIHQICQRLCRQCSFSVKTHKQYHFLKPRLHEIRIATSKRQCKTDFQSQRERSKNL